MKKRWKIISSVILLLLVVSCETTEIFIPKPTGYMRRKFPVKAFEIFNDSTCPYTFSYPKCARIENAKGCHKNIYMDDFKCEINFSYLPVDTNLFFMLEHIQKRVGEHTSVARAIDKTYYKNDSTKTYGALYRLDGDVAMNCIFYLTDSTDNFISGTMHFNATPNFDSLKPSLLYITEDLDSMLNSFQWLNK